MPNFIFTSEEDLKRLISTSIEVAAAKVVAGLPDSSPSPKEWLTNKEAMQFLGLSKTTMQRMRTCGSLPYSKVGGNIFYRYNDVVKVLASNSVT